MQRLDQRPLRRGAHASADDGMCAMEMVAWLAGEAHTDEPLCACPVIAAFVRAINDALPDDAGRDHYLRRLVPKLVNTARSRSVEGRRGFLVADTVTRTLVPLHLETLGLRLETLLLRALPPVTDADTARIAARALEIWAPDAAAARWLLQRAAEGVAPARFVAAAVHVVKQSRVPSGFGRLVGLASVMATLGRKADEVALT